MPELKILLEEAEGELTDLQREFRRHAARWVLETAKLSNTRDIAMHPSYQRIIGMGAVALPLIFEDMKRRPHHWFWALRAITGEDPVKPEALGKMGQMTEAWLEWARDRHLTK